NWLDIVIVLVIAFFASTAFRAGLIREVVTLVSVVVGVVIAGIFYDDLARDVLTFIDDEKTALVVGFLVLLGAVYLAGQLVAVMLKQAAALLFLGWADHAGGALFGLIKGLVVVEVLLILLVTFPRLGLKSDIDGSALASVFLDAAPLLLLVLPNEFERAVDVFVA
ncbi:MAG: CvpA family protein, partial [Chloroflexi bacterium]|nr:CvpA family protein [Chloroflexota bacterium]